MKKFFPIAGVIVILLVVAYFESTADSYHGFTPTFENEDAETVSGQNEEQQFETYSSVEYILEETEQVDGYLIETYRVYEVYEDENGEMIKREPTDEYEHLRYKI